MIADPCVRISRSAYAVRITPYADQPSRFTPWYLRFARYQGLVGEASHWEGTLW